MLEAAKGPSPPEENPAPPGSDRLRGSAVPPASLLEREDTSSQPRDLSPRWQRSFHSPVAERTAENLTGKARVYLAIFPVPLPAASFGLFLEPGALAALTALPAPPAHQPPPLPVLQRIPPSCQPNPESRRLWSRWEARPGFFIPRSCHRCHIVGTEQMLAE